MRLIVLLLTALALSACRFHPPPPPQLPHSPGPLVVPTRPPPSPLGLELTATLERAGFSGAPSGAASAALKITDEAWNTSPLSVDELARVREYITRYRVSFAVLDASGKIVVEPQTIELSREYTYDITASAGSPAEQELIQRELRRDMQAAILRRLDVVLRSKG